MKKVLLLFISILLPLCGWAEKQGYAVFNKSKGTLTFKYGEKPDGDNVYDTEDTWNDGLWFLWDREQLKKVIFDASYAKARPKSTANWFALAESLKQIVGIEYLNTSKVVNMSNMFHYCAALTSLDVSHFDTSNVTDMSYMFSQCNGLTSLDVSNFNTGKVTDMSFMFDCCSGLTSLNVSNFNTSKVTNMAGMFMNISFAELDLTSFDTRNVTNMDNMFNFCWQNLKRIYAGDKWSTKKVKSSKNMFENCNKLEGGLGTVFNEKYIDGTYARIDGGASSPGYLTSIEQKTYRGYAVFDSSKGTLTFKYGKLPSGDNVYDTGNTSYSPGWGKHLSSVKKVVFDSSYANARPRSTDSWFYGAESLTQIVGIEYLNTSNVENMSSMFLRCTSLTSLDVSHFNTSNVTSMYQMFYVCEKLTSLDLSHFDTRKVTKIAEMFLGCSGLTRLDLSNFDTSHVDDFQGMGHMFEYCDNLTSLDISNFNTSKVTVMSTMFNGCSNLTKLDLSSFDTRKVVNMVGMFAGCNVLTTINVSDKWSVANVTGDDYMFADCFQLVGGKGTKFDANHVGKEYARIDGGPDAPGYLTGKGGAPEPDEVTITAKSYTITYGDPIPTLEYTTKGATLKGTPALTCDATSASPVGTYDIKVGMGSVTNEKVSLVDGTLTITKAPLTISAGNYTKKQGEENPTFTPTYKGFKNNETEAVLTKQPTVTTTATKDSSAGTYDVTVSGAEAQNYEITYKNGTLTIEARPIEKGEYTHDNVVYEYGIQIKDDPNYYAQVKAGDESSAGSPDASGEVEILPWIDVDANRYMVIRINGAAFKGNKKITKVVIPGTVHSIMGGAFKDCTSLEEVDIKEPEAGMPSDGLVEIKEHAAFAGCTSLRTINLPNTLTSLGGSGVTRGSVFEDCSSLTSITIPSGVNGIPDKTFKNCTSLKEVQIKGSLGIGTEAFMGCTSLKSIDLSNGIKEAIGQYAFKSCTSLKTVVLPTNGGYDIGGECFKNCTSLESITFPAAVTNIGDNVCEGCIGMKVAVIEKSSKWRQPSALFRGCTSLKTATIGWEGRLPRYIFDGCSSLESVTLENATKEIGVSAFLNCESLKELTIPQYIEAVGDDAFKKCSSLESIVFPNTLTSLGASVFYNCISMKVIDLSECTGLTITNTYRDRNNTNLVFSGVPKETIILLPNSGGLIENEDVSYEFQEDNTVAVADGSEAAGEYEIPEAIEHDGVEYPVTTIGAEAFKDNTELTQVSIPGSIQSIGEEAFAGCINLSAIYAFATEPIPLGAGVTGTRAEGSSVFAGVDLENCVLYVPKGCVEKYRSAEGWGEFAHIVEMDMTAIWTVRHDEQEVGNYYNLHGQQVAHPGKGVYIKNGKKILKK